MRTGRSRARSLGWVAMVLGLLVTASCGGGDGESTATTDSDADTTSATPAPSESTEPPTTTAVATTVATTEASLGSGTVAVGGLTLAFEITACGDRPDSDTMTFDLIGEASDGSLVRVSQQIRDDGGTQQNIDLTLGGGYLRAVRVERDGQWTENFGLVDVDGPLFTEEGGVRGLRHRHLRPGHRARYAARGFRRRAARRDHRGDLQLS